MVTPSSRTARKASSGKYARGKYARAISDRSGLEYPYKEMVREWNGALVHTSEFEPKNPLLDPVSYTDPEALKNARPQASLAATGGVPDQITNTFPGTFGETGISYPKINTGIKANASIGTVTVVIS